VRRRREHLAGERVIEGRVAESETENLRPTSRSSAQVHSMRDTVEQMIVLVELEKFEGASRAPAFLLGTSVVDVSFVARGLAHVRCEVGGKFWQATPLVYLTATSWHTDAVALFCSVKRSPAENQPFRASLRAAAPLLP
jgi:hypothetical protein